MKTPLARRTVPAQRGLLHGLRQLSAQASTFQKIAGAVVAAAALIGMCVTAVTRYAPWAWASEVNARQTAIERKVDTLSTVVLESQIADLEARSAALEAKAKLPVGLTVPEAEYLRGLKRRLDALQKQLDTVGRSSK